MEKNYIDLLEKKDLYISMLQEVIKGKDRQLMELLERDNMEELEKTYEKVTEERDKLVQINRLLFNNLAYYCVMSDKTELMKKVIEKINRIADEDDLL